MATYPGGVVTATELPTRIDGQVVYSQHMNAVQDEIIAIETALGNGIQLRDGATTLVARLADLRDRLLLADVHRAATSGVHGVSGDSEVVGTTDTQTLSSKTLASPVITGSVALGNTTLDGDATFTGNVSFSGVPNFVGGLGLSNFTNAQHDHSSAAKGGNILVTAVSGLQELLDAKASAVHTHLKSQITDFQHSLAEHTGNLDAATRINGLGTSAYLNVPAANAAPAGPAEIVRGDDPRLSDQRTAANHAATHAANGVDPVSPASIGAAPAVHVHTKASITDFAHTLDSHDGSLTLSRVSGLVSALAGKLDDAATAANSLKVNGKRITVAKIAPGSPATGDVWITY